MAAEADFAALTGPAADSEGTKQRLPTALFLNSLPHSPALKIGQEPVSSGYLNFGRTFIFTFVNILVMKDYWRVFRAIGERTRFGIVFVLVGGEGCACELPSVVGRAQPTVSLQLKRLVNAGILSSRREGRKVLYRISDGRIKALFRAMAGK